VRHHRACKLLHRKLAGAGRPARRVSKLAQDLLD
jgi:hypothetical protein